MILLRLVYSFFLIALMLTSGLVSTPIYQNHTSINAAFAEDYSTLSDDELIELFQNQVITLDKIGQIVDEASIIDVTKQKLMNLKNKVLTDVENQNIKSSLISKIDSTLDKLDEASQYVETLDEQQANNMMNTAGNKINAFINSVEAQQGKKIPIELADELIEDASEIISDLTKRNKDIIPVIQNYDLPLAKSLIDRGEIEIETLRSIFAEIQDREIEVDFSFVRNSPVRALIIINDIIWDIENGVSALGLTYDVSNALEEAGEPPLNDFEIVGLFLINISILDSIDDLTKNQVKSNNIMKEIGHSLVSNKHFQELVGNILLELYEQALDGDFIEIEKEIILSLRNHLLPMLTVITDVINNNGGIAIASEFVVHVMGINPNPSSFTGVDSDGIQVRLAAGEYSIEQDPFVGYDITYSDDCSSVVNGPLKPADRRTCVITNDDQQAYIIVNKTVINDNGGSAVADDFLLTVDGNAALDEVAIPVNPGTHQVGETNLPGYTAGDFGGDCDALGSVTIALGEIKTCTITNDDVIVVIPAIFEENFDDGNLSNWNTCNNRFCQSGVSTSAVSHDAPSQPYWGFVNMIRTSPFNVIPSSESIFISFTVPSTGDYRISGTLVPSQCVSCIISAQVYVDDTLALEKIGQPAGSDPSEAIFTGSTTLSLNAGNHFLVLKSHSTRAYPGSFVSYFDDIRIEPVV